MRVYLLSTQRSLQTEQHEIQTLYSKISGNLCNPLSPLMKFSVPVEIQELSPPIAGQAGYQPLNPRAEYLPAGWHAPNAQKSLTCDMVVEHDVAIVMRDGVTLYTDVFRPATSPEKVPALICWSPFGKKFNGKDSLSLMTPWNLGLPEDALSGLEKFEGPDPADWVPKGYAIVNVDARGTGDSEGTMAVHGTQEAEDGYDVIEAIAKQDWCNGQIGLAGNSHLAIIQWFIAALKPPSLKAIAPWEGCGDLYREQFARGGIYSGDLFDNLIVKHMLRGRHGLESIREMYRKYPLANDYWNDKRPDMKKITIPTYITGTWTNSMHGMGAIRGWLEVATEDKWLRWHGTQEWYDLWGNQQSQAELAAFFDRYLKGVQNDWEKTPRVRMAVLRFGEQDPIINIVEDDFPMSRTEYRKLFLHPNNTLSSGGPPSIVNEISYDSEDTSDLIQFNYTFDKTTQIVGMTKAVLHMSCADADDMDVYVCLRKLSASGEPLLNLNIPWSAVPLSKMADIPESLRSEVIMYAGPTGILRASRRKMDLSRSIHENWPYHPHDEEQKIRPNTIVRLDIGIWATGIEFAAGERLALQVSGHHMGITGPFTTTEHSRNKGRHRIHFGGEYDSYVVVPVI